MIELIAGYTVGTVLGMWFGFKIANYNLSRVTHVATENTIIMLKEADALKPDWVDLANKHLDQQENGNDRS